MWIRLRRLTLIKNRQSNILSAKMRESASSVNPLHPSMAEVQAKATAYARHCADSGKKRCAGKHTENLDARGTPAAGVVQSSTSPPQQREHRREDATDHGREKTSDATRGSPIRRVRRAGVQQAPNQARDTCEPGPQVVDMSDDDGGDPSTPPPRGWQLLSSESASPSGATNGGHKGRHVPGVHDRSVNDCGPGAGGNTGRIAKWPLELSNTTGTRDESAGGVQRAVVGDGAPFSNLGLVRCTSAPNEFNVHVRVVGHFPPKVRG